MEKKKLLIADDIPENLAILYKTLRDDYDVFGACNGQEALRLAEKMVPDLILLDIMMPDMSGYEVCRIIKSQVALQDIPVIFVTALSEESDEARGFAIGGVDYITKPFRPAILKHRICTHLELKAQKDALSRKNTELGDALTRVRELSGLLPICMCCKKIRDDKGYWNQLEAYITRHSNVLFSHGICPECYDGEIRKITERDQETPG